MYLRGILSHLSLNNLDHYHQEHNNQNSQPPHTKKTTIIRMPYLGQLGEYEHSDPFYLGPEAAEARKVALESQKCLEMQKTGLFNQDIGAILGGLACGTIEQLVIEDIVEFAKDFPTPRSQNDAKRQLLSGHSDTCWATQKQQLWKIYQCMCENKVKMLRTQGRETKAPLCLGQRDLGKFAGATNTCLCLPGHNIIYKVHLVSSIKKDETTLRWVFNEKL